MKWCYILLFLGVIGPILGEEHSRVRRQSGVSPQRPQPGCPPADCPQDCARQFFKDPQTGCQRCRCDPSDNSHPFGPPLRPIVARPTPGFVCNPNPPCPQDCATTFTNDIQTGCRFCTCRPTVPRPTPGRPNPGSGTCSPGQTWTKECNSCFCTANGTPACTLKGCNVCLPVVCDVGCTKETPATGCPKCNCQPAPDRCPERPHCPADCAKEIVRDPQNGCKICRCKTDTTQINPFAPRPTSSGCPPRDCPADCSTEFIRNPQNGCVSCRCKTDATQINPFAPPACRPAQCPADCAPEIIRDPRTGCELCRCKTGFNIGNFANPFAG